jgi:hypothetical protein
MKDMPTIQEVAGVARKMGLLKFDYAEKCHRCGQTARYSANNCECVQCKREARKEAYRCVIAQWLIREVLRVLDHRE